MTFESLLSHVSFEFCLIFGEFSVFGKIGAEVTRGHVNLVFSDEAKILISGYKIGGTKDGRSE